MVSTNALQNPRVVIIGAGFGGLSAAKRLAESHCRITLIDRHNYHLFQPLLYQVATAALSPADIASPIRGIVRHYRNVNVILAVAQFGKIKLRGSVAWLLWSMAHIYFLIGFRNRIVVAMSWAWSYATFQRGTRLITGLSGSRMEDMPMPAPMDPPQSNQARHAA
jgi:NADH dehydrogenase FAD-containing subunit